MYRVPCTVCRVPCAVCRTKPPIKCPVFARVWLDQIPHRTPHGTHTHTHLHTHTHAHTHTRARAREALPRVSIFANGCGNLTQTSAAAIDRTDTMLLLWPSGAMALCSCAPVLLCCYAPVLLCSYLSFCAPVPPCSLAPVRMCSSQANPGYLREVCPVTCGVCVKVGTIPMACTPCRSCSLHHAVCVADGCSGLIKLHSNRALPHHMRGLRPGRYHA